MMTNKELFIEYVEAAFDVLEPGDDVREFFSSFKSEPVAPSFTENGYPIFEWMRNNANTYNNIFTSKCIAEGLGCSSRSVSGAIRKLVSDGWVLKSDGKPATYSISEAGLAYTMDAPVSLDN